MLGELDGRVKVSRLEKHFAWTKGEWGEHYSTATAPLAPTPCTIISIRF